METYLSKISDEEKPYIYRAVKPFSLGDGTCINEGDILKIVNLHTKKSFWNNAYEFVVADFGAPFPFFIGHTTETDSFFPHWYEGGRFETIEDFTPHIEKVFK